MVDRSGFLSNDRCDPKTRIRDESQIQRQHFHIRALLANNAIKMIN